MVLVPGSFVVHPGQPGWGVGQVQSVAGDRITVNFEHAGKIVIDSRHVDLDLADLAETLAHGPEISH